MRHLILILGDQLDRHSAAFDGFDRRCDVVWVTEASHESTRVWVSKPRIAVFLAAMRQFAAGLRAEGIRVDYRPLDPRPAIDGDAPVQDGHDDLDAGLDVAERCAPTLGARLAATLRRVRPERVILVEPGEWSLRAALRAVVDAAGVPCDERPDRHFLCSREQFADHARGRRQMRLEYFYREMRRRHRVLLDADGGPEGGEWNYDVENRASFDAGGPRALDPPPRAPLAAVEWVELPNTLGMSQYADGGAMASKPYVASGKYLRRMSNHCKGCRYDPARSTGAKACPFTTLYWDFLARHEPALRANPRMAMQLRNLARLDAGARAAIREQARGLQRRFATANAPSPGTAPETAPGTAPGAAPGTATATPR